MKESAKARARRIAHVQTMMALRPLVFLRDGYRCQAAGLLTGECRGPLAAHHRYIAHRVDTIENLVAVCEEHHTGDNGIHGWRQMHRAYAVGLLIREADGPPTREWRRFHDELPRFGFGD